MHGHQNAALTWLQTIAHIGQCAVHDGAHGVCQIAGVQLLLNGHFNNVINWRGCGWSRFTHGCGIFAISNATSFTTSFGAQKGTNLGTNLGTQFKHLF